MKGDLAYYNELEGMFLMTRKTQLIMIDKQDTLYLHSDSLRAVSSDSTKKHKILYAFHNVKFFRHDIQGKCDTLIYNTQDSIIYMLRHPVLWSDKSDI